MNIFFVRLNLALIGIYLLFVLPLWVSLIKGGKPSLPLISGIGEMLDRDRRATTEQSKIRLLNMLMPSGFGDLAELSQSRREAGTVDLGKYLAYYRHASVVLPAPLDADARALAAFCLFHQGHLKEADQFYLQSLKGNPAVLWTYHNLAVMRFRRGEYREAVALLNEELKMKPEISIKAVLSSKLYSDILRDIPRGGINWPEDMRATYSQAGRMLVISLFRLGDYREAISAAQYGLAAGFEPAVFFYYYVGLALKASGESQKAAEFLAAAPAAAEQTDIFTGQDISLRIF